ncbi:MAG: pilus assembly protein PilP [Thiohalophilus sp.]|uniref:pilus assembly protein PilP n=1 Tax=Thiohalophilus sp. TaxID=3028392 RepID=UPI0028702A34|nr:pilus assembly protein PilP [Thiohalophilus sp.]MDR9436499.1 pilus assembly protein PilP [Thiohalophilus sp.]
MLKTKLIKFGLLSVIPVLVTACGGPEHADLQQYVKQVKEQKKGRIEPLPEVKPYETFTYVPGDLRDPFAPFIQQQAVQETPVNSDLRPDTNRKREALEQFTLDSLVFVGHLEKDGVLWGLISAPDSTVYKVREGNYIGQNYGEIQEISETQILIQEIVSDGSGGWIEREASLSLESE